MTDNIANAFLFLTAEYFLMAFIIIGYLWLDKDIFLQALKIMLIGMIFNTALKGTFQVPLAAFLNKPGYAFPSGHMQLATTFFGWLALKFQYTSLRIIIALALVGIGMGLVHFGYHNYYDVSAAVFFAALTICGYYKINKDYNNLMPVIMLVVGSLLLIYIGFRFEKMPNHIWMAYYSIVGILLGEKLTVNMQVNDTNWRTKILNTIYCVFGLAVISIFFSKHNFVNTPNYILDIKSLIAGIAMPFLTVSRQKIKA